MKILLINPHITNADIYSKYSAGAPCLPPLGLCSLGAVLLEKKHEVRIVDCAAENIGISQLRQQIDAFMPRVVGVTSTTVSYHAARQVLQVLKESYPEITTVLGGAHLSAIPLETMKDCETLDIGVVGEGEQTLAEVVERLESSQPLNGVPGTLIRYQGAIIQNPVRKPVSDLDATPVPARHLLKDLRRYSHTPFRGARFTTTMITSRGCPFQCGYCDQSIFGRKWRAHSAEYVVKEIASLKERYGVEFISFEDDNFLLSKNRTIDICREMLGRRLDIGWSCLGRANEVDEEVLPLMKMAGCSVVYVGIESGSTRILELINKKLKMEETEKGIRLIKQHGINVMGSFILGIPTETRAEMEKTIRLALSLPLDGVSFFMFTPYPGTPLRELAKKHGRVSDDWRNYSGHPGTLPFVPSGMEEKDLLEVQTRAYRRFLIRPQYLVNHISLFANRSSISNGLRFLRALVPK